MASAFERMRHARVAGPATVTDGDSLTVTGQQVRLFGVGAPESRQTCQAAGKRWRCGRSANRVLAKRIAGRPVVCTKRDRDRYGRVVAVCRAGGEDFDGWLVSQGLALAYGKYSTAYVGQERAAKAVRRELWRGEFVASRDWRRGQRLSAAASADRTGECRIKGNISRSGTRIYHVPGAPDCRGFGRTARRSRAAAAPLRRLRFPHRSCYTLAVPDRPGRPWVSHPTHQGALPPPLHVVVDMRTAR